MDPSATTASDRWTMKGEGCIEWDVKSDSRLPHKDHIEMSGKKISTIISYGVDDNGELLLSRLLVWPTLRTIPNNTHASLKKEYGTEIIPLIKVDGVPLPVEQPYTISFDGVLTISSKTGNKLRLIRKMFPSTEAMAYLETIELVNDSDHPVQVDISPVRDERIARGVKGVYVLEASHDAPRNVILPAGCSCSFALTISGRGVMEPSVRCDWRMEEQKRRALVSRSAQAVRLETPDPVLNQGFAFAKLRLLESIYDTKGGLMHGPGGGSYYAAVWTNDQAEYAGPFFAFLGDEDGIEASLNAYRLYMPFMGPDYTAIPSSIIAEGVDIWEGVGDRGDAAMYAYGASRFALTVGDRELGEQLWPAIEWCLTYNRKKLTGDGVIASDSDELENRFPSGDANLSTSSLGYGALRSAAGLARSLGRPEEAERYEQEAVRLAEAIERYFGAEVEGYPTYRYYDGNEVLRSWICIPLTMGIMDRKDGTLDALFESRLWTEDGLATQAGDATFWDRSTLYGFRGALYAGEVKRTLPYMRAYARRRLLGDHVPYAVEAYPEGNQRHLSAESALYCRMFTEGLFGIEPTALDAFDCIPRMPEEWDRIALRDIRAFGRRFDVEVERLGQETEVRILADGRKSMIRTPHMTKLKVRFAEDGAIIMEAKEMP